MSSADTAHLEKDELLEDLRLMLLSRAFDDACARVLASGDSLPHYHSGVGQEALMVATVTPLRASDQIIYTHRGYGHLLAKGVPLLQIACDLLMKEGGTNLGLGGVMHVNRPDLGVPGREGVFGTRFGLAVGLGLASQLDEQDDVVVCFYGEAAGARGQLYEAMNMSVLWNLPIVFVAENNGWSFTSRTEWLFPKGRMSNVWRGFEIPVEVVDGNDVEAIHLTMRGLVEHARSGGGPCVMEGLTYRVAPHIWYDNATYQPPAERENWPGGDPILRARALLRTHGEPPSVYDSLVRDAEESVAAAMADAERRPAATWQSSGRMVPA